MAFEVLLQGASSHKALMDLQDYEIKYLEHMKKCVCHKIKVERDYSAALSGLASLFSKLESSEFDTSIFKLWRRMGQQMEVHAKKIRSVADYMCCSILDQMQQVISEKKAVKRLFQEESHRFQQNTDQQVQELARHTKQMSKCIDKWHKARENYKNSCASKGSLRHEEVKGRLVQGEASMNLRHNEHTLLLRRLNLLEKQKVATLLPSLLNTQQRLQTGLLSQCKNIVVDFVDLCKGEPLEDVKEQLLQLDCSSEYQAFAHSFKSESPKVTFHEFSVPSPFPPNDLLLNDVTVPLLKQIRDGYIEEMEKSRHWQRSKRSQLLQQSLPSNNILTKLVGARYKNLTQMQIVEKECLSERLQMMVDFIEDSVHNNQTRRDESSGTDDFESSNLPSCFSAYAELDGLDYEHFVEHMRSVWEEDSKWSLHHITSLFAFKKTHHNNNVEEIAANNIPNSNISKDKNNNNNNNSNDVTTTFKNNKNASFNSCSNDPINNNNNIDHVSNNNSNNNIDELNNNISTSPDNNISIDNYNDSNNNLDNNNNNINNNNIDNIKNDIINNNDVNDTNTESSDASRCALEAEEWYHGILPREEVQKLLLEEGDFLVRCSSNKKTHKALIVLSVCWQSAHKHFIVQEDQEGYRFEGLPHKSIRDLIMHLLHHNEAVTRKSGVVLRRAVVRMDWELKAHEVQLMEKLGSGQFGEVFKGVLLSSNQEVAVKTCRESLSVEQKRKFLEEGQLLKRYEHPNIVKFIGIVAHKHPVMVVMEYVDGGSLLTYLREEACMEERRLVAICKDCATGMQYLEKNKVLHRDLAARNCLIERSGVVKISDFGMSRQEAEYVISGGLKKIPIKWTAPEALNFGVYTSACDVWSYGVLMWEVFSKGTHPFLHLSNSQARMHIDNGYRMEQPQGCGDDVYQLMLQCWSHDPILRPSFALILQSLSSLS